MKIKLKIVENCFSTEEEIKKFIPAYAENNENVLALKANNLKKLYSGTRELNLKIIEKTLVKGFFNLRPWERVLIGTGFSFDIPKKYQLKIHPNNELVLRKGVSVLNNLPIICEECENEICYVITNTTNYSMKINFGEVLAYATIEAVESVTEWEF